MTGLIIHQAGQPGREILLRGFAPVAEIVRCVLPPRPVSPVPRVRRHFTAPITIPKLSTK